MRRPGIGRWLLLGLSLTVSGARSAPLLPSADPVASFVAAADSIYRAGGDPALSAFVHDNPFLVGAGVARLLDVAFTTAQSTDRDARTRASAEKAGLDLARRVALAHQSDGGTAAARNLVDAYRRWTAAQRGQRANAIALEAQSNDARKAGDIDKAVKLLADARAIYEKIGDRHSVAVNWGTMGVTHWSAGKWDVVIADYEQALAARRAVEDRILEGRTLNGLGSAWQQKGEWEKAGDYYRQAIDLRRKTGDNTGLGTSITYLGHVYVNTGRYVAARTQYEAALPIVQSLGNPSQSIDLLSGIAAVNAKMGRLDDSHDAYERAIKLAGDNGIPDKQISLLIGLADAERFEGRYTDALDHLTAAESLLATHPDPVNQTTLHLNRGLTYMDMGELDDARVDLLKSAELAQSLDDPTNAILAQNSIAFLYHELGAYDRALAAADKARELSEKAANGRGYRDAMALRGAVQFHIGHYDDALASYREALAQDQADGADALAIADEISIAGVGAAKGETSAARDALRALGPRIRAATSPILEIGVLTTMAHSFEKEIPDSAMHYYELSLSRLENAGERIGGAEINTGYLSGKNRYYFEEVARYYAAQAAAQPAAEAVWSSRAFDTMERAKARGLLDMLRSSMSTRSTAEEDAALDALYSLDPTQADYADQRVSIEQKYLELRRSRVDAAVAGILPARDVTSPTRTAVTRLDDIARLLPKKTVLFEFALGDSSSLLWVIQRDRSDLHRLAPRGAVEAEVRRLRDAIAKPGSGDAAMLASARTLYRMLLEPGAQAIAKNETVVIVPDGALFELPFDALLTADPVAGVPMSKQPFLVRKVATACTPSATVYAKLRSAVRTQDHNRDLFAVGNPDFTGLATTDTDPLAPLPFAQQEVDAVGAKVKPDRRTVLTGRGASESAVKRELRTESPRVVHLATHGLVDANEPARSSVALAPGDGEDGFFHTLEIISTPTTSDLVVISACESARGRVSRGEGVVGLSRAFLGAGAESVVASLWAVSDESTAVLMRVFYDRMFGKKQSASRALRDARMSLLESEKVFSSVFLVSVRGNRNGAFAVVGISIWRNWS
jgi:CHAT domain-containing protein/Tfp pilus assembly protein PilF